MTDPISDRDRRQATGAAQALTDMPDMVLAVQFHRSAPLDEVRAAIETVLASPAVFRVGVAPVADGDPNRRIN